MEYFARLNALSSWTTSLLTKTNLTWIRCWHAYKAKIPSLSEEKI